MQINFLDIARIEFKDAIEYYNEQSEGLGYEFALEVRRTIERISNYEKSWPILSDHTRRARTNRFPYGIVYSHDEDEILIIAVMHLHRDPDYWKDRLHSPVE
ncbi:MAG: type II toxin-antitoxin system RelE/ParE family toxin [Spirochaetaceae bacterium]|jgi:hypothetical protein|nr:type II toxin-antitoxin system RelE/ParE family toxin [Spirochaetaceae bacterium]